MLYRSVQDPQLLLYIPFSQDRSCGTGQRLQAFRILSATPLWLAAVPCPCRCLLLGIAGVVDIGIPLAIILFHACRRHRSRVPPSGSRPWISSGRIPDVIRQVPWGLWPITSACVIRVWVRLQGNSTTVHGTHKFDATWYSGAPLPCSVWLSAVFRAMRGRFGTPPVKRRSLGSGRTGHRSANQPRSTWKAIFVIYLVGVDAGTLHVGSALWHSCLLKSAHIASSVQLYAHGFHEGRPVFSTGPVPTTSQEEDLCEVLPLGRPGNHLLTPSRRPRRQLAMFLGRSGGEADLEPCPIIFSVDERLHGNCLHRRLLLSVGAGDLRFTAFSLHSPLPGLPSEQLLFTPVDLGWNSVRLPVDLRPIGGRISLLRCARDDLCSRLLAAALDQQGIFRPVTGILGRCCWGWFSLASQPLLAPGVDTLQFLPGPDPYGLQPLFGTTSEPPVSLQTNMQVSTLPSPPPHEIFQGFSANHAVLITPQRLVYVEVPVFADAATYRRLVGLQADPPPGGGIMRLWQPLPLLPHVQFLEIHCLAEQAPCVLDFRPMGWRIMTVCVDPPVSACSAVQAAVASGVDVPEWIEDCHASRLGVLHRERAVRPTAPLLGGPPFVLLFFPHVFGVDDSSSDGQVGGGASFNPDHTVLPPLGEESGGRTPPLTSQVVAASSHRGPPHQQSLPALNTERSWILRQSPTMTLTVPHTTLALPSGGFDRSCSLLTGPLSLALR